MPQLDGSIRVSKNGFNLGDYLVYVITEKVNLEAGCFPSWCFVSKPKVKQVSFQSIKIPDNLTGIIIIKYDDFLGTVNVPVNTHFSEEIKNMHLNSLIDFRCF